MGSFIVEEESCRDPCSPPHPCSDQPIRRLTAANATLGTVDEVLGAGVANGRVNPSANTLNDQYARFGRCMAEQMKIHDLGHELALLIGYNRKDPASQTAVEKASSVCAGVVIMPDANYKQSLKANP